jgi:hypothetical protein
VTNDGGPHPESEPFGRLFEEDDDTGDEPAAEDDLFPDDEDLVEDGPHTALPPKVDAWRRRSATGAVLTGFALGLQQALGKEQEQPAVIMQTSGDPPMDLPVEAEVEQGRPRQSVVNIRPWLLTDRREPTEPGTGAESGAGSTGPGDRASRDSAHGPEDA